MACGARRCGPLSFCHEATNTCKQCADICHAEQRGHYEPTLCLEQCRDYLQQQDTPAVDGTARMLGAVGLAVSLVAVIALLLMVGLLLFCVYRRPRRLLSFLQARVEDAQPDSPDMKVKMSNNNKCDIGRDLNSSVCTVSGSISEPELRHHIHLPAPQQPTHPQHPHHTFPAALAVPAVPPPPARHPSEDSTLDYAAYDNPALSPSSSPLPPGSGSAASNGGGLKAMDAVLDAVLDHSSLPGTLPGTMPRGHGHGGVCNGTSSNLHNGSVARMESSF